MATTPRGSGAEITIDLQDVLEHGSIESAIAECRPDGILLATAGAAGMPVCDTSEMCGAGVSADECEENARTINAAPLMLAAVRDTIGFLRDENRTVSDVAALRVTLERAEAALVGTGAEP